MEMDIETLSPVEKTESVYSAKTSPEFQMQTGLREHSTCGIWCREVWSCLPVWETVTVTKVTPYTKYPASKRPHSAL